MMELLLVAVFCWLFFGVVKLILRLAWGGMKIVASLLCTAAVPLLILCLIFAGGLLLLIPVALIGIAFGILKACT